jgi:hypothetical protein
MNELKLQHLIFSQIALLVQGLPTKQSTQELIIEVSNLLLAYNYVGNTDSDNIILRNAISSKLTFVNITENYTQNLFNGYFQTTT